MQVVLTRYRRTESALHDSVLGRYRRIVILREGVRHETVWSYTIEGHLTGLSTIPINCPPLKNETTPANAKTSGPSNRKKMVLATGMAIVLFATLECLAQSTWIQGTHLLPQWGAKRILPAV